MCNILTTRIVSFLLNPSTLIVSKPYTNDGLRQSDTGCFMATVDVKGLIPSQPHPVHSPPDSPHPARITSSQSPPSLSSSLVSSTPSTFYSRLRIHLFHKSFPPVLSFPLDGLHRIELRGEMCIGFLFFFYISILRYDCAIPSWLHRTFTYSRLGESVSKSVSRFI